MWIWRDVFGCSCIKGMLGKQTVLLVTHQLQYLPSCDRVCFLRDKQAVVGTHEELMRECDDYRVMIEQHSRSEEEEEKEEKEEKEGREVERVEDQKEQCDGCREALPAPLRTLLSFFTAFEVANFRWLFLYIFLWSSSGQFGMLFQAYWMQDIIG